MPTTAPTTPRPTLSAHEHRLHGHDEQLRDIEARLDKYDVIIGRLDVLIDVLTKNFDALSAKTDQMADAQGEATAENAHRYATVAWSVTTGIIVSVVTLVIAHALHF